MSASIDALSDEVKFLYAASNRLTQASTPTEWLEAISVYAREQGATTGVLLYMETDDAGHPEWAEIVAYWTVGPGLSAEVGSRFNLSEMSEFLAMMIRSQDRPLFVHDAMTNEQLGERVRRLNQLYNMHSAVVLPLNNNGRWVGFAMFTWSEQRYFDERDKRVFTAMIQQAAPVIDSMRLYDQSRERAVRAEHLLKMNAALSQATNEIDILDAVALYAASRGVFAISLEYVDYTETDAPLSPSIFRTVAIWSEGQTKTLEATQFTTYPITNFGLDVLLREKPDEALLIENLLEDSRITEQDRKFVLDHLQSRAMALLPLLSGARFLGGVSIMWDTPHTFSDEERYIFNAVIQPLASTVARRRAYLAEQEARRESELLYRASKGINAAITFTEIVEAVENLNFSSPQATLLVFENFDYDNATYVELITRGQNGWLENKRMPLDLFPIGRTMPRDELLIIEDTANRDQIDEVTAATLEDSGIRALIDVPLVVSDRWMGLISFASPTPRTYTPLERRIAAGIGDLVASAVERVRLRERTEASRMRAELLAQVNAALSQATDEQAILSAVSLMAEQYQVSLSTLAYLDIDDKNELRAINIVALRSADGSSPLPPELLPIPYFKTESYPVFQVAYANPDEPTFIEDVMTDPRTEMGDTRRFSAELDWRALILIPLRAGDQWQGLLTFIWNQPQTFDHELRRLFTLVRPPASAVVATRRAYLAEEQARQESEMLYRASEAINAANTYHEITQAVSQLEGGTHGIVLTLWENFDFDRATYNEVVATAANSPMQVGHRNYIDEYPVVYKWPRKGLWIIEDIETDTHVDPVSAASWLKHGTRARIGVPLTLNNRWMGNLAFHNTRPKTYTQLEKRFVIGIGDLVTAAVERIRLREQTENARIRAERQAQVNAALSQATDEWEILSAVSRYLADLNPELTTLNFVEEDENNQPDGMIPVAAWENGGPSRDNPILNHKFTIEEYPSSRMWLNEVDRVLMVGDVTADDDHLLEKKFRKFVRAAGFVALVMIPLYSGGRWQGTITMAWRTRRHFTDADYEMCHALIQTVGAVVASRRAYQAEEAARKETELRAHELETVAKVSAVAASVLNEVDLLETVSQLTRVSFSEYHIAIYLLDSEGKTLVRATNPVEDAEDCEQRISIDNPRSLIAQAAQIREGVMVDDITTTTDYRLKPFSPEIRSEMAVPMVVVDRLIGVLDVQSPEVGRFRSDDIRVMSTLADLIAVSVENARLYQQAQEVAAFEERNRLARELHDSVSQALYGIALGTRTARILYDRDPAKVIEPLDYVKSLAQAALTEMRALIFELRPESLENEGLVMALTKQAESVQARHGIQVEVELGEEPSYPIEMKEAIYRIAREALHNIVKHANATQVKLCVSQDNTTVTLEIHDNGKGFDPGGKFPGHLGLQSMRERAERLNGTITIESAPGQGTHIRVQIPGA
jgi:signal transduction histidine kinase